MNRKSFYAAILGMAILGASAPYAAAQAGPGGGQGGGQGGGRGQRMSPDEMRQRMATRMKEQLGATDDEWSALQPKVEKVMQLQRETRGGGFGFGGRGGGPGGLGANDNADAPTNPVAVATRELQTVLDNKDANPEQIKARLTALRDARVKARENLTKAQAELKELLTVRQEATLVSTGMLD